MAPDDGGPVDEPCTTPHPITEQEETHTEQEETHNEHTDTVVDTVVDTVTDTVVGDCVGVDDVVLHNHNPDVDAETTTDAHVEGSFV